MSQTYCVEIQFDRGNSTYKPEEIVSGNIVLIHKNLDNFKVDISSLIINPKGLLTIHNRQNNKKIQNLSKQLKSIAILKVQPIQVANNKTITHQTKIPFRFKLVKGEHRYIETYIGVYIVVNYEILVDIKFTANTKLHESIPFYVQVPKQGRQMIDNFIYPKKKNFMIRSQDLKGNVQKFKIRGQLQSQICYFSEDLNGFIVVDYADSTIRSIDVQMYRVEKILTEKQKVIERTQIQMIQMCDGNVTKNLQLPIYMILPRYYSCPSFKYLWCQIDFEVDLLIIFKDGLKVTSNIPLKLIRS